MEDISNGRAIGFMILTAIFPIVGLLVGAFYLIKGKIPLGIGLIATGLIFWLIWILVWSI